MCISVAGASMDSSKPLHMWDYTGAQEQGWYLEPVKAVVILPGIMGTELFAGKNNTKYPYMTKLWDPKVGIDAFNKIKSLACDSNGNSLNDIYAANENFGAQGAYKRMFDKLSKTFKAPYYITYFPYDWRMSCKDAATSLNNYIVSNGYNSVILVAHSMGGLVASNYLAIGQAQRDKVDKLITLGTPYLGAPKVLDIFINGGILDSFLTDELLEITGAIPGIMPNIKSVYELMPSQNWFTTAQKTLYTYTKHYTVPGHPDDGKTVTEITYSATKQNFYNKIDKFNNNLLVKAESMHNSLFVGNRHITNYVDAYYIVGTNKSTITSVTANVSDGLTIDQLSFRFTNQGDDTVPFWSADIGGLYPSKTYYAVNRSHGGTIDTNGNIKSEGLIVSENTLQLVINIINNAPNSIPTGINKTRPQ